MARETTRFSPRIFARTTLAAIAASGRLRALRLLWQTSKGWLAAVAVLAVLDASLLLDPFHDVLRLRPLLLVLDEPTASLDAPTEAALFELQARSYR